MKKGTAFALVRALLAINERARQPLVEVVLISRNDADSGLRIFNSIEYWKLGISRAAFTDGRESYKYLEPFSCNLFLSTERAEVVAALRRGYPAALVYRPPDNTEMDSNEVRIAFDGDAVLFSGEADQVFRNAGMQSFQESEALLDNIPLEPGPLKGFLEALSKIQKSFPERECPIRLALVTARAAPAHKRPTKTLRAWNIRLDETFFLGGVEKAKVLAVFRPHIFFDDERANLEPYQRKGPVAEVPQN